MVDEISPQAQSEDVPKKSGRGSRPGERRGGRQKGSRNKAVIEREEQARLTRERIELEMQALGGKDPALTAALIEGKKLAKDVLSDFMELFAGMAAYYQPTPANLPQNANANRGMFEVYAFAAVDAAKALAPFQSPRFSAMMVGATVVNKIEVTGGMPDDFASGPAPALPAGTIVTADEVTPAEKVEVVPPLKVAAG